MKPRCWLAAFSDAPCDGELWKCHLLPRQLLRRELGPRDGRKAAADPRSWVWGCGGPMGCTGHHGMLDYSRKLRVPRGALPAGLEVLAAEVGLEWWLDREYGPSA